MLMEEGWCFQIRLIIFNGNHKLDISHDIIYFDYHDVQERGVDTVVEEIKKFKPDLIIEEEKNDGLSLYSDIYKKLPKIPKAWWNIDSHTNLINHVVYSKQFDYVFCGQSWFIPIIEREVKGKVFFLPLSHTQTMTEYQEMLNTPLVRKDIDLSFIGNIRTIHVEREHYVRHFLEMLGDKFFARMSDYQSSLGYLRRSKMTLNCSLNNDMNFRVWEGIACGTLVLTDDVTDIDKIKDLRKYLLVYDKLNPDWTVMQKIVMFNPQDREAFAKSHTLTHRYLQILEMIETGEQHDYSK